MIRNSVSIDRVIQSFNTRESKLKVKAFSNPSEKRFSTQTHTKTKTFGIHINIDLKEKIPKFFEINVFGTEKLE